MPCQAGTLAFSAVVRRLADAARIITWQARRSWRPASPLASTWLPLACATTFALVPPARAEEASLYEVLGVDRNATEQEIKKAYKRAAVKFHPDKAHESERPQYEERFKRISRAYEILSDPEKRRSYDARGEAAFDGRDAAGFNGFGAGADPFDMFRSMFGQNFGFGQQRTPDVGYEVEATMEELYAGFSRNLSYERDAVCRKCKGMGGTDVRHCARCRGMGVVVEEHQLGPGYVQRMQRTCGACMGQGRQVRDVCSSCRGAGFMKEKATDSLEVSCCPSDSYGVLANHELGACPGGVWALFFGYSFGSSSIVACSFDAGNHGPCISPRHPSARAFTKMGDLLSEAAQCSLLTTQNRGPDSWCQEFNL
ncbi:unnamed protein product [Effrenium voratum]|nr:unnamed protein product [Effrenium voratum]